MVEGVTVLDRPARSLDLNPIENLWNELVRRVYKYFRQFDHDDDLCEAIILRGRQSNYRGFRI